MTRDKWCEKFRDRLEKIGVSLHCEDDEDTIYAYISKGKEVLLYLNFNDKEIYMAGQGKVLLNWENYTTTKTRKQTETAFEKVYKKAKELMKKAHCPRLYAWGKESYDDHHCWKIKLFDSPDKDHKWVVDRCIVIGVYHRVWRLTTPLAAAKIVDGLFKECGND